ncbi:MAG: diguanylate cyclase domain-containing protein, partial [Beijerinckiaceae bacterium]
MTQLNSRLPDSAPLSQNARARYGGQLLRKPQWLYGMLAAVGFLVFVGGSYLIAERAKHELLQENAASTAYAWGRTLSRQLDDLALVLDGAEPSRATRDYLAKAKEMGGIFRYKLFDKRGQLRFSSDDQLWQGMDKRVLAEHNPEAAGAIEQGRAFVLGKFGDGVSRPPVYASAYIPLLIDGVRIGILEVYVDHTGHAKVIQHQLAIAGLQVMALTSIAFLLPMLGFVWQARQRDRTVLQLDHAVRHDELTGVLNRSAFAEEIAGMAGSKQRFAVHFVDLDHFKQVNDTYGHAMGDHVLKDAAQRLGNLAGAAHAVARLGGDEFAVLQILDDDDAAVTLADQIARCLCVSFQFADQPILIGGSVGTALHPLHGGRVNDLLKAADIALYAAKRNGRGQAILFHAGLEEERRLRQQLEARLREATEQGDFELHFQPLYEAMSGELRGFEALLRLKAADGSPI